MLMNWNIIKNAFWGNDISSRSDLKSLNRELGLEKCGRRLEIQLFQNQGCSGGY